mmetsp:Transcript_49831/g.113181  ORF Transcript_49831/g.113181 Transcript_49831/m.113181 type:complete len:239 (+) Transcript_49831:226-942(+)|eukprot:CAMPEP_0172601718 /NCGR_PEP_ID=MMETSP1068-20121228/21894_1 /TAXON_ID=35684 /ORGANISM="Pseudopedinella elastica, Strain CCMP716" /LENGTH=238 /DNA_ID=CAMNT_0013402811 /DNA_START=148 /DNA_END=864 /DNA_ORIENTATION=-
MPPNIRKRAPANSNKNTRLHIAFDEKERTDYLSGFSKRKQERRRYGLAMGELKRKRQLLEERKERRALQKDSQPQIEDEHVEIKPSAPTTFEFSDALTMGMFGDVVCVTTTMDSLGTGAGDDDEDDRFGGGDGDFESTEEREAKRAKSSGSEGNTADAEQRYAYSFKAIKAKIDAAPLSTKRERRAKRNKSQNKLDSKYGGGKQGGRKELDASALALKAVKTADFGKKKSRTKNAKRK